MKLPVLYLMFLLEHVNLSPALGLEEPYRRVTRNPGIVLLFLLICLKIFSKEMKGSPHLLVRKKIAPLLKLEN